MISREQAQARLRHLPFGWAFLTIIGTSSYLIASLILGTHYNRGFADGMEAHQEMDKALGDVWDGRYSYQQWRDAYSKGWNDAFSYLKIAPPGIDFPKVQRVECEVNMTACDSPSSL